MDCAALGVEVVGAAPGVPLLDAVVKEVTVMTGRLVGAKLTVRDPVTGTESEPEEAVMMDTEAVESVALGVCYEVSWSLVTLQARPS